MSWNKVAPPWVIWAIEQARPQIEATVGPRMLPPSWDILGCGVFGCTMDTSDPKWVCKVTIDGSEAFFARALPRFGRLPGVCRYLPPLHVDSPAGRIWVLWRSRVEMPHLDAVRGQLAAGMPDYSELKWSRFDELSGKTSTRGHIGDDPLLRRALKSKLSEEQTDEFDQWWDHVDQLKAEDEHKRGLDTYAILQAMTQAGLAVSGAVVTAQADGDDIEQFILRLDRTEREAIARFAPRSDLHEYWRYGEVDSEDNYEKAAFRLLGYGWQLARLGETVLVSEMARSLRTLYDDGILMADLNADNIARLDGVWTLFDGGFCVPTGSKWISLWNEVGAVPNCWWDQRRWEPLERLKPSQWK